MRAKLALTAGHAGIAPEPSHAGRLLQRLDGDPQHLGRRLSVYQVQPPVGGLFWARSPGHRRQDPRGVRPAVLQEVRPDVSAGHRNRRADPQLRDDDPPAGPAGGSRLLARSHLPVPLPDGRRGRGTVSVDITDIKRAEVALRQSYDELATIYDGMFDGLLVADLETKQYVKANPSICRMLGYEEKELLSMSIGDIHPADEAPVVLERIQARVEGRFHGQVDTRLLRKDGAVRYANVASSPIIYRRRPQHRRLLPRRYRTQAGRGGHGTRTSNAQAPSSIQRSRTATDRLRDP